MYRQMKYKYKDERLTAWWGCQQYHGIGRPKTNIKRMVDRIAKFAKTTMEWAEPKEL